MTTKRKRKKKRSKKAVKLDSLKQINLNAAGLDIGSEEIWTCVPEGRDEESVRVFPSFTPDLYALADWLQECDVETVAMESTGVYWIPIYEILEARGFEVYLVNARHIKNVPGKKTDVMDCQWIQQLHTYGLLQASFRPEEEMAALRSYIRHRDNLTRYRSGHIQHMQKALHLMNLLLPKVVTDITGKTGMEIIRAIVRGTHDPVKLAQYRDPRCRSSKEDIAKALTGNYRPEHLFALKQALALYDFYSQQIEDCDIEIEQKYAAFKPVIDTKANPLSPRSKRPSKNEPDFNLRAALYRVCGVDLTAIDGLNTLTVQQIISEVGTDMSKFPTVKHFTSWLTLAPHNDVSGGKVLRSKTKKSKNRAAQAFRMAAQSVSRSHSALGAFYRRMHIKHGGGAKAITATAHKIARIFYFILKHKQDYKDPGQEYYEQKYKERIIKSLKRKARSLDMELVPARGVSR